MPDMTTPAPEEPQPSAANRAYRAIERLIVTLELAPSSIATEGTIIERIGLGRTPVREAIQRLAWEGLVEVRPRTGLTIAPLNPADWLRVLDARRGVEVVLARSAARFITPQADHLFQDAAIAMHSAVEMKDVNRFLDADKSLDYALAIASANPFAVRVAAPLQSHSRRFWYRYRRASGLAESAEQHVRLISAILDGEEDRAGAEADRLMALLRAHAEAAAGV